MRNKRRILFFSALSILLTIFIISGTGYASLGKMFSGDTYDTVVDVFTTAPKSARDSHSPFPREPYASAGMKVFRTEDNLLEVYGFRPGSDQGILGARFDPDEEVLTLDPKGTKIEGDHGWHIIIYYIEPGNLGRLVFQVNLYNAEGVLQDDGFRFDRDPINLVD